MITSLLDSLLQVQKGTPEELWNYLVDHNITVFNPLYAKYTQAEAKSIVYYLLYAYSEDSPYLILDGDYIDEKRAITEKLQIPEYLREHLIKLTDETIRGVGADYVNERAAADWRDLTFAKIMKYDLQTAILKRMATIGTDEGIGELLKMHEQVGKITQQIKDLEGQYKGKYGYIETNNLKKESKESEKNQRHAATEKSQWIQR